MFSGLKYGIHLIHVKVEGSGIAMESLDWGDHPFVAGKPKTNLPFILQTGL